MPNFLENHQFRVCIDIHTTFLDNPKMWILNSPETVQGCARQRALLRRASGWDRPSTADALAMGCTWRKISQRVWPIATGVAGRLIWKMGKTNPKMGGLDITIYFIHLYSFICSSIFLFIYLFVLFLHWKNGGVNMQKRWRVTGVHFWKAGLLKAMTAISGRLKVFVFKSSFCICFHECSMNVPWFSAV